MSAQVVVRDLAMRFPLRGGDAVHAVNGVSFSIERGRALGLVGESGSGKSTVGRCVLRLLRPTSGSVMFDGLPLLDLDEAEVRRLRSRMQIVFQDPFDALNPRKSVGWLLDEPLRLHTRLQRGARQRRAVELLEMVGLSASHLPRFTRELSGGQLQRVSIARAIATEPDLLVLDEPTSSLDMTVRAGVLELLDTLRRELGLTYLLISHDLATVAEHCDDVAVMYLGTVVEEGPAAQLFARPQHPYSQALLSAFLTADPGVTSRRVVLAGEMPSAIDLPPGCPFASRCPLVLPVCEEARPAYRPVGRDHLAACVRVDDGSNQLLVPAP